MNNNQQKYLLKGDVSGIQEFIFSTTSIRAARTLKARSWYIKAICEICGETINNIFEEKMFLKYTTEMD